MRICLLTCLALAITLGTARAAELPAAQVEFFEKSIRPLLAKHCFECHGAKAKKLKGGLRMDSRANLLKGGDSGAAVVPGKADDSLLIQSVRYEDQEMPPDGKLSPPEIAALVRWVEMGAPWPASKGEPIANVKKQYDWKKLRGEHWAWKPVGKHAPPSVQNKSWPKNDIDRFLLARLEAAGLSPAAPAERRVLIRRAYFDLIGLPPTPEEVLAFEKNQRPDAYAQLIDRLLAMPQYGERWGRHWLDVARYSDGFGGFSNNAALPHAWQYRDWVVGAFNRDLPYDEFVKQQIAGDLMKVEGAATATGFFALGPTYGSDGGDPDSVSQAKSETLDDRVDTLTRAFLALTAACARCHDHKFDPIPQQDYYSLAGVFNNSKNVVGPKPQAHVLADSGSGDMKVALRGDLRKPGEVAPRRFLKIIAGENPPLFDKGSGRMQLAEAVASGDNPLTARVMVNRIWQHHFGQALVRSPSNFGSLGSPPSHPELLDWLARKFVESGWSIKKMHRTIMLSSAYQMSSQFDKDGFGKDGDNVLLWRFSPRRLTVENWRDSLLTVTGELDRKLGGPPVDNILSTRRRTMYAKVSRAGDRFSSDTFLRLFDFPVPRASSAGRVTSIVPQQFLFMMNSPFMAERAKALTARLEGEAKDDAARIELAYRLLYGRSPTAEEKRLGLEFVSAAVDQADKIAVSRWQQYAQVLLSSNEFMYVQ
ncbi:MAG: PSD1 domain-containing protein [Planctomycetes bacterium]|nr:PSD1 domain-containing protein [Planctomycetota bacterium]